MRNAIHLSDYVKNGSLFTDCEDDHKLQAFIPTPCITNHAASMIDLANGDLLCSWFAGLSEGSSDISIVYARLNAGESAWQYCGILSEDSSRSEQNPCFFQSKDGTLYLLHTAQQSRGKMTVEEWYQKRKRGEVSGHFSMQETAQIRCRISHDNGYTWEPTTIFSDRPGSFCRHPILELSNGDWLFPMWYSLPTEDAHKQYGEDYSTVRLSSDEGKSWSEVEIPNGKRRVHMTVVETKAGHCVAFLRSRSADYIYKSVSDDYGRNWTVPMPTVLPNNNASIQAALLPSGAIAIIYNAYSASQDGDGVEWPGLRYSLTVAITEDVGETFPFRRVVECGNGFQGEENQRYNQACEYPCILQGRDGRIHIAYSHHNRTHIKYLCVTEEWLRRGI